MVSASPWTVIHMGSKLKLLSFPAFYQFAPTVHASLNTTTIPRSVEFIGRQALSFIREPHAYSTTSASKILSCSTFMLVLEKIRKGEFIMTLYFPNNVAPVSESFTKILVIICAIYLLIRGNQVFIIQELLIMLFKKLVRGYRASTRTIEHLLWLSIQHLSGLKCIYQD